MGVSTLSFRSFHSRFFWKSWVPLQGPDLQKSWAGGRLPGKKSVGKCRAEAAGSRGLWRSWEEISWGIFSEIGSHLLSYQAGCQAVMAPERCSAALLWRMGPAEICLPSALLKHSISSLILLITPALSHTRSGFTFWLYLLHMHSLEPRAILKPSRQHWCPQDFSRASRALQRWSLRMTHTKLLFSSPAVQCRS